MCKVHLERRTTRGNKRLNVNEVACTTEISILMLLNPDSEVPSGDRVKLLQMGLNLNI